ncbi:MAG: hypothetical protein Ct9H300mP14_00410 [Gammaproteobacteria bacterium]|nr:MAG: hypothetical protein Ct9H300mP14_00410 [Gammaproteobacteria bacterium]
MICAKYCATALKTQTGLHGLWEIWGIGTELALNGLSPMFLSISFTRHFLFMSMGAVLYRTGTIPRADLGGSTGQSPGQQLLIVGAMSISAFPLLGVCRKVADHVCRN